MDRPTRNAIERATQRARRLLEDEFAEQLEGRFDVLRDGRIGAASTRLSADDQARRRSILAALDRKRTHGMDDRQSVTDYLRDAAFTTLNRFVALKMLEARELLQECITKGEQSNGYIEFTGMAPGIALLPDGRGYRLYLESLFDELSTEIKVLFDRLDPASALWPRHAAFQELLDTLNGTELAAIWAEDETIGWVYQYFNGADERKRMRQESQAPRNSRELAVRNQFFTPRYVVQFLVDNTLGRTWMEMTGGRTRLADSCEYLVRPTDEPLGTRVSKDPRDFKILDPACGSGHFLLYAFDLLLTIYEGAWAFDQAPASELTKRSLRADYPDLSDLRAAAPGLIVEHNLHGVDIDARCAQIAALALWLRAQRAYRDLGLKPDARPRITRTHIVIAEPMPGDKELAAAFAKNLQPPFVATLFQRMVQEMRLAGELGTLLQVEKSLANDIHRARQQFLESEQQRMFQELQPRYEQGKLDLSGVTDESVFHEAEQRILSALDRFATSSAADARRRLFAEDAGQGVALIDLVRTRFDVVLMNPPFGAASAASKAEFEKSYPRTKNDIYAAFVERGFGLLIDAGILGAITSRTGFILSSFEKWRTEVLLRDSIPVAFADLGAGVMDDANVEAAAYCLARESGTSTSVFVRVLGLPNPAEMLRRAIQDPSSATGLWRFEVQPHSFSSVPESPFAYRAPNQMLRLASSGNTLSALGLTARQGFGASTRFHRLSWELPPSELHIGSSWLWMAHGTTPRPFYKPSYFIVRWSDSGHEAKTDVITRYPYLNGNYGFKIQAEEHYGEPGLCYGKRTGHFTAQVMPPGHAFSFEGTAIHHLDQTSDLWPYLGLLNSSPVAWWLNEVCAQHKAYTYVNATPAPVHAFADLGFLAVRGWHVQRELGARDEVANYFGLPALLLSGNGALTTRAAEWARRSGQLIAELNAIQSEIDDRSFALYGIHDTDRRTIAEGFGIAATAESADEDAEEDADSEDHEADSAVDTAMLAAELVSWAVGVAFGRFDVRLATGERPLPGEPEPFDPLPVCSPGMLTGDDGLPLARPPAGYLLAFPEDGVLVDDPGHDRDLVARVRQVFEVVFGVSADAIWQEASSLLDPRGGDLRSWLASGFFEHHLKRHSKSRRKAPILWQLGVPSGRYSVWAYAHRMGRDSLLAMSNELVGPKVAHEERRLSSLRTQGGANPSAKERAEIAAAEAFLDELRTFADEVRRVAPLWDPDLDDGIVLVMAPLWRLVPGHRAWQKELRTKWDELCAGKYDWAHLSMHLWPERVVPKCATDRSLAIAHGLEDVFWIEGSDGKWTRRAQSTRSIEDLVAERTSPAVKAALASLLEAPAPAGGGGRGRRKAG